MFLEVRQKFLDEWLNVKPKMQRAFLAGKITYTEAVEFSKRTRTQNKSFLAIVDSLHVRRHSVLMRKFKDLDLSHDDIDQFMNEVESMHAHICRSVLSGKLTLTQARFANQSKFGAKGVADLSRTNAQPVPYRDRKFRLGTEHSVRNPLKVRSHTSGQFSSVR